MTVSPERADFEGDRAQREPLTGAEDDVLALVRAKALERDPDACRTRLQVGDLELATLVGRGDALDQRGLR